MADLYFSMAYDKAPPDDASSPFFLGWRLARAGKLRSAERYLKEAWNRDPGHVYARCEWARVMARLGHIQEALEHLHALRYSHPEEPAVYLAESELLMISQDFPAAVDALYEARQVGASDEEYGEALAKIFHGQAVQYLREGQLDEAYRLLMRSVELMPHWSSPYVNLGHIAQVRGDNHEAEILYRKALELDPENAVALYNLSSLYVEMGEYGEARQTVILLAEKFHDYPGIAELTDKIVEGLDESGENH